MLTADINSMNEFYSDITINNHINSTSGCAIQSDLFKLFHVCFCSERAHTFQSRFSGLATQIPSTLISEEPRETRSLSWICTILPHLVKIVYKFSWHFYLNVVTRIKKCVKITKVRDQNIITAPGLELRGP